MLLVSYLFTSFDSFRFENMLLLLAKETSSLLLVLPIATLISALQHTPTSFISFFWIHEGSLVLFVEKV